ncbi:MAG: NnrS family protein [Chloroflexi bacterium]|nr:NnrS family protein [Chloroflexota bacterium]
MWRPFVWTALGLAVAAGFGLGGALFAARALQAPLGTWWLAAAQAHGHIQLFGWAGLMVLGVGFHFLPRLRGAPLARPGHTRAVVGLLAAGLALRALAQPLLALAAPGAVSQALRLALALSGLLELAGASLALGLLGQTLRHGPSVRERAGFWPVLPFFASAFAALWLALALNLAGLATATGGLVSASVDQATMLLAFYAFLVPVSVAMSARTFPLYFRTPLPRLGRLQVGLALLLAGLAVRLWGDLGGAPLAAGLGRLGLAAALGVFILALGIFAPRRALPHRVVRPLADPIHLHALCAYLWLVGAALLLAAAGLEVVALPPDAERHALGAGFVTLLILGMGLHLLPGFAGRPLRSRGLVWATLALGNAAALLRVGPVLLPTLVPATLASALLASSGLAGVAALVLFGLNLR